MTEQASMKRQTLSLDEINWLKTIFRCNGFYDTKEVTEKQKQDNKHLTLTFIQNGLLDEKEYGGKKLVAFTNRGLAHLVVDAKVPFSQVYEFFKEAMGELQKEVELKRKNLANNEELNILYYATFAKYLEYDLFDDANNFRTAWGMPPKEIARLSIDIMLLAAEDERFSVPSIGKSLAWPDDMMEMVGISRASAKALLKQALEMYRKK